MCLPIGTCWLPLRECCHEDSGHSSGSFPAGWSKPSEPLLDAKVDFNEQVQGVPSWQGSVPRPLPWGCTQQGSGCSCHSSLGPAPVVVDVAQDPGCGQQEGREHQAQGHSLFLRGTRSRNQWHGCTAAIAQGSRNGRAATIQHHTQLASPCSSQALAPALGLWRSCGEQSCSHWQWMELVLSRFVPLGHRSSA